MNDSLMTTQHENNNGCQTICEHCDEIIMIIKIVRTKTLLVMLIS